MFKISRRQTILRASLLGCLVVAVLSTAAYFIINQHQNSHATVDGERVLVRFEDGEQHNYHYGTGNNGNGTTTRPYEVVSSSGTYDAMCAQPRQGSPVNDKYEAQLLTGDHNNRYIVKLILYLQQHEPNNAIFNNISNSSNWGTSEGRRRFAFTHALIGYLYGASEDTTGLSNSEVELIIQKISALRQLIDNNDPSWVTASSYNLFRTKAENQADKGKQDVVWLEPSGSIIVRKRDSNTHLASPQGDASFNSIIFTVTDGSKTFTQTITDASTSATFTGLDPNKTYTVSESGGNGTYTLIPAKGNITPTASGTEVVFENNVKTGKLIVNKKDKDTDSCSNITNGLTFVGIQFKLYNASSNSVYYENGNKPVGGLVATRELTAENPCSVSFEGLPYGRYELEEYIPDSIKGWVKDTTRKPITINPNSDSDPAVEYTIENQPIRGDLRFVKKDPNNNTVIPNAIFEITSISNNYTESHIVVSDENGIVDTGANPHSFHTNGYDDPYYHYQDDAINLPYAGYGTWFGIDNNNQPIPVKDSVGALPYGTYLIQEKRCDQFIFCQNVNNEKRVFSITEHGVTVSFEDTDGDGEGDWNNDCAEFTLATNATDNSDGDHYIEAGQDTAIKDVVNYCAKAGFTFTIKGILMDKSTNQPLLINGETLEQSVEISPTDNDCGTVEMLFPINSSDLAGKSVVVFEKLYYKNELKATHEDIDDEDQTVDIVSLGTVAKNEENDTKFFVEGEEATIVDTVEYCFTKDMPITVQGVLINKNTGEPLLINGEKVEQSASILHAREENCGTLELSFELEDTTGLAGTPIVVYETLYQIVPVPGGGDGEGTLEKVISHEDLNDPDQTVYVIDISTTVQPTEDGTKVFPLDSDITVTDTVHYCLQPGLEYTVKGIVMDKSTGNGLLVDSQLVEQSVTFTPTEFCGEIPMYYTFNTKGLAGAQLVIFESLYYNDELLIEHKDIENELESFEIDITPPETGFITKNTSGNQETSHQELLIIAVIAIAPVGVYAISRRQARKHFLNR